MGIGLGAAPSGPRTLARARPVDRSARRRAHRRRAHAGEPVRQRGEHERQHRPEDDVAAERRVCGCSSLRAPPSARGRGGGRASGSASRPRSGRGRCGISGPGCSRSRASPRAPRRPGRHRARTRRRRCRAGRASPRRRTRPARATRARRTSGPPARGDQGDGQAVGPIPQLVTRDGRPTPAAAPPCDLPAAASPPRCMHRTGPRPLPPCPRRLRHRGRVQFVQSVLNEPPRCVMPRCPQR
jgi:hypothetical protein